MGAARGGDVAPQGATTAVTAGAGEGETTVAAAGMGLRCTGDVACAGIGAPQFTWAAPGATTGAAAGALAKVAAAWGGEAWGGAASTALRLADGLVSFDGGGTATTETSCPLSASPVVPEAAVLRGDGSA